MIPINVIDPQFRDALQKKLSHCRYSSDLWSIVTSVVVKSWIPKIMTFTLKFYTFLELLKCDLIMTVLFKALLRSVGGCDLCDNCYLETGVLSSEDWWAGACRGLRVRWSSLSRTMLVTMMTMFPI